jgi:redox-sensitive bicupin YhaK (pirin superfamily)
MQILKIIKSQATQDGDGVNISRVADFSGKSFDPFLMLDELKSGDKNDYMGGFPAHPHRGIETFTYIIKGGFEHQDQMGNKKVISAGNVQWMSTGYGVIHSEMPVADAQHGMHGFQIWLNMPAKDKLRPSRYQDSSDNALPILSDDKGASLTLLAGEWSLDTKTAISPLNGLAGDGAIADLRLTKNAQASFDLSSYQQVLVYVHSGAVTNPSLKAGEMAIVDAQQLITLKGSDKGAGLLILTGNKINEEIVHMGPFVMNTQQEIRQAISDYQNGKFGEIA